MRLDNLMTFSARRESVRWLGACALILGVTAAAGAGTLTLKDSYGSGPGGEFSVTAFTPPVHAASLLGASVVHAANAADFQTFCVEKDEFIAFNTTYHWKVSDAAEDGGIGGPNPDPISPQTAYLFSEFWRGTLSDYFTGDRVTMANELQEAIWYLEEEIGLTTGQASDWVTEAQTAGWTNTGQVRVLNLYANYNATTGYSGNKQDQLVMVVPTPTAVTAGSMLLVGAAWISRGRSFSSLSNSAL